MEDMPKDELCSYCFGTKLRMMRESPYSAYDELYASMLEHVNKGRPWIISTPGIVHQLTTVANF